jgi:hypothetical protein
MAAKPDRIFVSIAVSRPGGGLDHLPGAVTAATRMAAWASSHGYLSMLVHDAPLVTSQTAAAAGGGYPEVTVDLLRHLITEAITEITDSNELKRIVVFFAGHGAAHGVGDQYWMLSNWNRRTTEAIKVSALQRMLEYYAPRQVAIIGDACQEFSARFIDVIGSAVLDRPDEEPQQYELDQFLAVDVGKQAFMIKGIGTKEPFCLFTEVLLDALKGEAPASSFEQIGNDRVLTSQSLAQYLIETIPRVAGKYGVRMTPRPKPGFWTDRAYMSMPPPVERGGVNNDATKNVLSRPQSRSADSVGLLEPETGRGNVDSLDAAVLKAREERRRAFADELGRATVRDHFETRAGICVSGAQVVRVEASLGNVSRVPENPNWFRIDLEDKSSHGWSDVIVTLEDGRICSVCAVQGFVAALHVSPDRSEISLFHRPVGASDDESGMAIGLLAQLHSGLQSEQQIIDTATLLRQGKHRVVTMGCIAAQFYDVIRDVDSLRQMASFYAFHQQPVPLDIVLYGGGTLSEENGRLYVDIPAVPERQPRTAGETRHSFTFSPTPGFTRYPIAGRLPWMREAWSAVATALCHPSARQWQEDAMAAKAWLSSGTFTRFNSAAHVMVTRLARVNVRGELGSMMT